MPGVAAINAVVVPLIALEAGTEALRAHAALIDPVAVRVQAVLHVVPTKRHAI